jgi:hypothetical protein
MKMQAYLDEYEMKKRINSKNFIKIPDVKLDKDYQIVLEEK